MNSTNLPDLFPQIEIKVLNRDAVQPGLTLFCLSNVHRGAPITLVIIDFDGNVRWWYQHGEIPNMRGDTDVRRVPDGLLVCGTNMFKKDIEVKPFLLSWKGEVIWEGPIVNHHHIHMTPEGHLMFLITEQRYFPHLRSTLVSDAIIEYDPCSDSTVWEWRLFDHLTPEVRRRDWSHCNTIEPTLNGDGYYLSARNLDSIFKIDRHKEKIIWRLGRNGDFEVPAKDRFYRQHSPEIQPNGNLLVFDNGSFRPEEDGGEYSRAIEYSIDEDSMQARAAWVWRNNPDLFTPIWGDADRLANGNTLMAFGNRVPMRSLSGTALSGRKIPTTTSRIIEVSPKGEKVWEVEFAPNQWGIYRAERIEQDDDFMNGAWGNGG